MNGRRAKRTLQEDVCAQLALLKFCSLQHRRKTSAHARVSTTRKCQTCSQRRQLGKLLSLCFNLKEYKAQFLRSEYKKGLR